MKKILSGNEAFARAAFEAGVGFVSSYPGTPSTEITEHIVQYDRIVSEWSTNEKTATEAVIGASIAGRRAMTCMKHVGLNLASEPLMTGSYTGVNAGVVIVVADDPNMYSSQNEQDSRNYARFAKVPMIEPADSNEALIYTKKAFEISEEYCTPVLVRSVTRVSHSMSIVETSEPIDVVDMEFDKSIPKWVMTPNNARVRRVIVEERLQKLQKLSNECATLFSTDSDIGIVCSGIAYQYVKEVMPEANILKLGMVYPLPIEKIEEFSKSVKKMYVIEELDRFLETEILAAGIAVEKSTRSVIGELSSDAVREIFGKPVKHSEPTKEVLPFRPPNLCPGCSHRGIFYAISRLKLFSFGDIGCYTLGLLPPLSAINTTVCMGASVSMAHGADRAKEGVSKKSIAVLGDSTFIHTGLSGLINAVYNKGTSTIVILDNRITGMTGHQPNAASGFTIKGEPANSINFVELCKAVGVKHVRVVNPFNVKECMDVLKEETERDEVSVIITDKPCIFADRSVIKPSVTIEENTCSGCTICTKIGCPAILWDPVKRKASVDKSMCTGCDLCINVCRFGAILKGDNNG